MRKSVAVGLITAVTTLVAAAATPSGAAVRAGGSPAPYSLNGDGFKLVTQEAAPSGAVSAVYRKGGVTVTVAAPIGSAVDVAANDDTASATVTTPDPKTTPPTTAVTSGQALMDNALAVGFTPKQAFRMAQELRVHLTKNVTINGMSIQQARLRWGGSNSREAGVRQSESGEATVIPNAGIIASPCVSVGGDGGSATSRFCDVQKKVQANGTDWYLGDEGSGTASDSNWKLKQFRGNTAYGSGNSEVEWRPTGTVSLGSCTTKTFSIGYNGNTISSSSSSCPDKLDPYLGDTHFGINWSGCNHNNDGISPVDLVHSPPNASAAISVDVKIAWGSFFDPC